jgi:hypothetical protein
MPVSSIKKQEPIRSSVQEFCKGNMAKYLAGSQASAGPLDPKTGKKAIYK